jgi:hypothetical protein
VIEDDLEVALRFRWQRLDRRVELRLSKRGREMLNKAKEDGTRIPRDTWIEGTAYGFAGVRELLPEEPGVYLVEAFHTKGSCMPDSGSVSKEVFHELIDVFETRDEEARDGYDQFRGQDLLWFYVGMAGNLRRRFSQHEQRASALIAGLSDAMAADDLVLRVSILRDAAIVFEGVESDPGLDSDLGRVLFEHAALAAYRRESPNARFLNVEKLARTDSSEDSDDSPIRAK